MVKLHGLRIAVALGLLALGCLPARAEIKYVIAISVDGGRGDFIRDLMVEAPGEFPNFVRLRDMGASTFNARCDFTESITIPNHLSMLTGRPVRTPEGMEETVQHGFFSNFPTGADTVHDSGLNPGVYKASIYDVAHDRGLNTALYLTKYRLSIVQRSWTARAGAPDAIGVDNGKNKIDFALVEDASTSAYFSDLLASVKRGTLRRFSFFHMVEQDTAGHSYGWSKDVGSNWRTSLHGLDVQLGTLLNALAANPAIGPKTAIILTADHGGGGAEVLKDHTTATAVENYTIPFMLAAPGVPAGSDLYELMENRWEPGSSRPDYNAPEQPIRNGDVANLCTALLGLPALPGSLMRPELKKPMTLTREGEQVTVAWPAYLTGYTLERCVGQATGAWTGIMEGIVEAEGQYRWHGTLTTEGQVFFRLRAPVEDAVPIPKQVKASRRPSTKGGKK